MRVVRNLIISAASHIVTNARQTRDLYNEGVFLLIVDKFLFGILEVPVVLIHVLDEGVGSRLKETVEVSGEFAETLGLLLKVFIGGSGFDVAEAQVLKIGVLKATRFLLKLRIHQIVKAVSPYEEAILDVHTAL